VSVILNLKIKNKFTKNILVDKYTFKMSGSLANTDHTDLTKFEVFLQKAL